MKINEERVLEVLPGVKRRPTPKGWYMHDCVYCGKEGHCGVNFKSTAKYSYPSFNCFKCDESGSIFKLLKQLGRLDVIDGTLRYGIEEKIENRIAIEESTEEEEEMPTITKPIGFRRIQSNDYLESRGFTSDQFRKYEVGITRLFKELKDYVIFLLYQNSELKGYIARTTWPKEKIEKYNQTHEEYHRKYRNAPGVDFSKALFGYDEITEETKVVVLVEGITDKFNVERRMFLDEDEEVKCCATFGKKISDMQISKLIQKGIEKVILMYDPDAIDSSKQYSFELSKFFEVLVAYCPSKDPGDMNFKEILDSLGAAESPEEFSINKVHKKKIK